MIQQIVFGLILIAGGAFFTKNALRIRKNILSGRKEDITDSKKERLKQMILVAFGQKKMFKKPIPAILHLFVYVGFFIVNLELLEIIIDGLSGGHRVFKPFLGGVYPSLINFFEFFAVAVLVSCVFFLIRRNILHIKRFRLPDLKKWPKLDANIILYVEIFLMVALLSMNATDTVIQQRAGIDQSFFFSDLLTPLFSGLSDSGLIVAERTAWWLHIIGILGFANYVLYSKHLHIFLSFPNTWYGRLKPKGQMNNMDAVTKEVKIMLGMQADSGEAPQEIERFGAKDATDLTWKNLMDAYSCTECGRCTASCPANITGKKLSPRKIMMDTRDRIDETGRYLAKGNEKEDGKSLLGDYITDEEINACTSCNACVEACPININPLDIILQLRRYRVMEESKAPGEWTNMFGNIETSFSPWKFPPTDRFNWANDLKE